MLVTGLRPSDEVFATCSGSFAEYAVARPAKLARKPSSPTFEKAAAVPVSGLAALQAVRDHGHVRAAQRVLIIGASGGIGTFAVQIAKAFGAKVTGVCSSAKVDLVRSIGADHVIEYTRAEITEARKRYDVVLDIAGNRPLRELRAVLTDDGRLVIVGGEGGGCWIGGVDRQLRTMVLSPFVRQWLGTFVTRENSRDLDALTQLIESGAVTPVIGSVRPLRGVPSAIDDLREGRVRGKIVIAPRDPLAGHASERA
jgi:NADPH:quinone reductase-like Zn-dependent oxidoreductase